MRASTLRSMAARTEEAILSLILVWGPKIIARKQMCALLALFSTMGQSLLLFSTIRSRSLGNN